MSKAAVLSFVAMCTLGFTFATASDALAQPPKDVIIVNAPDEPVPVVVQNPPAPAGAQPFHRFLVGAMAEDPERARRGFSWGELGMSMGIGAVLAPVLVVAPELAVPLAAYGVAGGVEEISEGHYGTGAFDIVTSLAPFGSKRVRASTVGRGTYWGQMRGQGPAATPAARMQRFTLIQDNMRQFFPSPFGRHDHCVSA